jgi:hypothetical protein
VNGLEPSVPETVKREGILAKKGHWLDPDLRVIAASRSFYRTFAVTPRKTEGQLVFELGDGQWNIPGLRKGHCHVNRKFAGRMTMAATVHAATVAWRHVNIA